MDVVAFLSVYHARQLQKFALPRMPDWMAAMNQSAKCGDNRCTY